MAKFLQMRGEIMERRTFFATVCGLLCFPWGLRSKQVRRPRLTCCGIMEWDWGEQRVLIVYMVSNEGYFTASWRPMTDKERTAPVYDVQTSKKVSGEYIERYCVFSRQATRLAQQDGRLVVDKGQLRRIVEYRQLIIG